MQGEKRSSKNYSNCFNELTSWLPYQETDQRRSYISDAKILNHVNVYVRGQGEKSFSIWCDPLCKNGGRYSMVHYKHPQTQIESFGMVVAILFYSVKDGVNAEVFFLTTLVARLIISDSVTDRSVFPLPLHRFEKASDRRFQVDQIQFKDILNPVFYVAHGVPEVPVNSSNVDSIGRFYIITPSIVSCDKRLSYDYYLSCNKVRTGKNMKLSILDFNVYMNIDELQSLKSLLCVTQKCVKNKKEVIEVLKVAEDVLRFSDDESSSEDNTIVDSASEETDSVFSIDDVDI